MPGRMTGGAPWVLPAPERRRPEPRRAWSRPVPFCARPGSPPQRWPPGLLRARSATRRGTVLRPAHVHRRGLVASHAGVHRDEGLVGRRAPPRVRLQVAVAAVRRVGDVQHQPEVDPAVARDHGGRRRGERRVGHEELFEDRRAGARSIRATVSVFASTRLRSGPVLADQSLELAAAGRRRRRDEATQVRVVGLELCGEQLQVVAERDDLRAEVALGVEHDPAVGEQSVGSAGGCGSRPPPARCSSRAAAGGRGRSRSKALSSSLTVVRSSGSGTDVASELQVGQQGVDRGRRPGVLDRDDRAVLQDRPRLRTAAAGRRTAHRPRTGWR